MNHNGDTVLLPPTGIKSIDDKVMAQLGPAVMQQLPFVITHTGAMEQSVYAYINAEIAKGNSFVCKLCWNAKAGSQNLHASVGGRSFCDMGCGVCGQPMHEHAQPCPDPRNK